MTTVGVFFQEAGALAYPFSKQKYIRHISQLGSAIEELGADFRVVRHQSSYLGAGKFDQSWQLINEQVIETGAITADVVFDKGLFVGDGKVPVLNCQEINDICTNKYKTFELFPKYSPQTFLVADVAELDAALAAISGNYKVVKPLDGLEARNVHIGDSKYLKEQEYIYPLLVQEFIDSQAGIPGIIDGVHDFRVAILNGEIVHSLVRTPGPGKLVASVSQGGIMKVVENIDSLPQETWELIEYVEQRMAIYGSRFYGIDMAFVNGEPKIIELNSRVSIWDDKQHKVFAITKRKLAHFLVSLASEN